VGRITSFEVGLPLVAGLESDLRDHNLHSRTYA
jgi:hypothetical protein